MFCGNCGAKLDDGDVFCPYCGSKVEQQAPAVVGSTQTSVNTVPNNNHNDSARVGGTSGSFVDSWNRISQEKLGIDDDRPITHEYQKLGGWLAFVAYGMLIGSVLTMLVVIVEFIGSLSMTNSVLGGIGSNIVVAVYFVAILAAAAVVFVAYKMFVLIQKRDSGFLHFYETVAIVFVGATVGIYIFLFIYLRSMLGVYASYAMSSAFGSMIGSVISMGIGFAIWIAYFVKSVRVRTYFGTDEYIKKSIFCKNVTPPTPAVPDR